jgi:hypothetical protein
MLAQIDSLPGAQHQLTVMYRHSHLTTDQGAFYMSRHVVCPFVHVFVIRSILGSQHVEVGFHIPTYTAVRILIDTQGGRGVLQEEMRQANMDLPQFRQLSEYFTGYQVKTPGLGTQPYLFL